MVDVNPPQKRRSGRPFSPHFEVEVLLLSYRINFDFVI